jgi:formamidopyrimidine-DNA glycosylase
MPELPEVETVVRGLRREAVGRRVTTVEILREDHLLPSAQALAEGLTGRRLIEARRLGKIWLLELEDDLTLVGHLRMTGQLRVQPADEPRQPHTHWIATLDDGRELRWRDVRRFGWMHLLPSAEAAELPDLTALGPDALAIAPAQLAAALGRTSRALKPLLLDQTVIAGLGNIYVDEILHRCRLHPRKPANRVSAKRAKELHGVMIEVLAAAIEACGSSVKGYVGTDGRPGGYQSAHRVYRRTGQPCPACGTAIAREIVGSRSTHYCPRCQRL